MLKYAQGVLRFRSWIIALTLCATAALAFFASNLRVAIDPATIAPQGHPYIQQSRLIDKMFGSKYLILIGITPVKGDIFQPAVLDRVSRITRKLEASDGVVRSTLVSLAARQAKGIKGTADGFEAKPLLSGGAVDAAAIAQLKAALAANPVYLDTAVSADRRTAAILVEMKERPDGFRNMVQPVKDIVDAEAGPDVRIHLGGSPVYLDKTEQYAARINFLFPIALLVIGLLHFEAFRTRQGLILPLVTALMAVVWGAGFMGMLRQSFDIFNSPTPILILAVAAGHAVQLLKRYYEEYEALRRTGALNPVEANRQAVINSLVGTGPVMIIAGGVAALGFFSLLAFKIAAIRTFGFFTGVGIVSAVLLEMTFIPAVRSLLAPPSDTERLTEKRNRIWDRIPEWIATQVIVPANRRRLMLVSGVLTVFFLVGTQGIVIDNAGKNYFSSKLDIQEDDAFLNRQLGGTNSLYIMVDGGAPDSIKQPAVLAAIESTQHVAERDAIVGKTVSIVDYIKRMNLAVHGDAPAFGVLPGDTGTVAQYLLLYSMSGEPGDFDSYVDSDYRRAKITILLKTGSNAEVKRLLDGLTAHMTRVFGTSVKISLGGDIVQTIALTDTMVKGKILNIIQIALAIFVISALAFRSLLAGFIVLLPLAMAVLAVFGVMGALGIPLNIPNSLISAMAVGIGADYAIYFLYRLREQIRSGQNRYVAMRNTFATAGKAALFVATAVAGGYGVLALSLGYNIHLWLSLFIVLAMLVSVMASLTLVPAMVLYLQPRFIFNDARRRPLWQLVSVLVIGAGAMLLVAAGARAEPSGALSIMQKNAAATRLKDSVSDATFTLISRDGGKRVRTTSGATLLQENGQDNMRLVRFLAPADIKGTASLMIEHDKGEDDMWIYLPALGKVRRLSAANKKDSFVGTDFSYGDVIGYKTDEWNHKLLREETIGAVPHYVIESVPANEAVRNNSGYSRRVSWIRTDNYVASRVETWDLGMQPLKRMQFSQIEQVGKEGRWQAKLAEAENLQTGHRTSIQLNAFKADQGVSARLFTPGELEK